MPDRNWVARSALLRKGGAHTRTRSSHRFSQDQQLLDEIEEYLNEKEQDEGRSEPPAQDFGLIVSCRMI